jgi:hypothetical protein
MISLEQVHREMNSKTVQNVADVAFDEWHWDHCDPKSRTALKQIIRSAFGGRPSTKHEKLAVEALLMIKFENFMKERKTFMEGEELEQCYSCRNYYLCEALERCDSCDSLMCIECSKLDEDFDMTFCSECYSLSLREI